MADGTQISTFGRANRDTPARLRSRRIICSVVSKSVIAPPRSGRTATMKLGVRPIMSQASWPVANTSLVRRFLAITVGSFMMMPSPCLYTRVFAVPRSIARSRAMVISPVAALVQYGSAHASARANHPKGHSGGDEIGRHHPRACVDDRRLPRDRPVLQQMQWRSMQTPSWSPTLLRGRTPTP